MRIPNPARVAVACLMAGALACAGNSAKVDDETAAAQQDTTNTAAAQQDTTANQAPPGYSGMERDTTMAPDSAPTAVDTFLNEQGTGVPTDTQGYSGMERQDTSAASQQQGQTGYDTTSAAGQTDTSGMSNMPGMDSTGMSNPQDSIPQ